MPAKTIAQQVNKQASQKNIPLSVLCELTYQCNLSCYYCYQKNVPKGAELSCTQWEAIFRQLARMGTLYLTFSGGEPFLREDFLDIVSAACSHDFAISIISNGTLLTKNKVKRLAGLGIMDMGLSFHAAGKALHDRLAGKKGSFDKTLLALRLCVDAGIKTLIKHSVSTENFMEFSKLAEMADKEGSFFECDGNVVPHERGVASPFAINQDQYKIFLKAMKAAPLPRFFKASNYDTLHCDAGRSLCGITPQGDVVPCIQLPVVLGNLQKKTFGEIWRSPAAKKFRVQEKSLDEACETCGIRQFCSRCHGIAFHETNGNWQGASSCLCSRAGAMASLSRSKRK
jgi:radical SAM additional 4Fe4S-binding domain